MPKQKPLKWALPENVHPADTVCYQIEVPNDRAYIGAFLGAMFLLSKPYAWGDDSAHTAIEVGAVWRNVFDNLIKNHCGQCAELIGAGCGEDCMCGCLRFQNGVLQTLNCGVWEDVPGQPAGGVFPPAQPGGGIPIPGPGGCQSYKATIPAGGSWLLPTLVSTGDILTLSNALGATTDAAPLGRWNCPDGQQFQLGSCNGNQINDGSDPDPSLFDGQIMIQIGSSFYDPFMPFTIPGGISNQQLALVINYQSGGNFSGEYTADIEFCNNSTGTFTHTFNFVTTPATFQPYTDSLFTTPIGEYTPGTGWTDTFQVEAGVGFRVAAAERAFDARTITRILMTFDMVPGHNDSGGSPGIQLFLNGSLVASIPWSSEITADDQTLEFVGSFAAATVFGMFVGCGNQSGGVDPGGSATITRVVIEGIGNDPF